LACAGTELAREGLDGGLPSRMLITPTTTSPLGAQ
jgi:hypothetical protein